MHRMSTAPLTALGTAAALISAALIGAAPAGAAPAGSQPVFRQVNESVPDWCGVQGLTVRVVGTAQGWEVFRTRGKDSASFYQSKTKLSEVHIAPNGVRTRFTANVLDKDTSVVETASTFEVDALATGNSTLYGPDGKAIARDPGQIRYHLSIDKATGEETFTVLRESTGRSDDFCAAELAAFGY